MRATIPLLALLLASCSTPAPTAPEAPAEQAQKGKRGKKGGAKDNLSNEAADPPASVIAVIPPTAVDAAPASTAAAVPPPTTPPNVVVVLGCTVRKDQISVYGGPAGVTPFLSELAARGVVFDDLIAAAPWTRAASTAILTGHHAVTVGMVDPGGGRDQRRLPDAVATLGERFHDRGYLTIGATANPNLSEAFGFHQGYDVYQPGMKTSWGKHDGNGVVDAVLTALDGERARGDARPAFLRMMLIDAHSPRSATGDKLDPYREPDVPDRVAQYRYHLHQLDAALAHLAEGLKARGMDESNTVFVFVADHGEGMNYPRHHGYSHGQYHGSSTNHVPWLLAGAGVAQGHRVYGLASQVDVLPTLLGVIGQPLRDGESAEGVDLSALVRGEGQVTPTPSVISDTWFQESSRAAIWTRTTQCQDDFGSTPRQQAKGLFVTGCFDRRADPLFKAPTQDEALLTELRAWRAAKAEALSGVQAEEVEVDEALGKQLELLGYRE